jgi:hypothetical protein
MTEYCGRYIPMELQTTYSEFKKKSCSLMWKFLRAILRMESPRDSNRDLHIVTWPIHRENCRWNHRQKEYVADSIGKSELYITILLTLPSPISLFFSPSQLSSPKLQTTTPPKKNPPLLNTSHISSSFVVTTFVFWFIVDFVIFCK